MTSARIPYFGLKDYYLGHVARNSWNRVVGYDTIHEFILPYRDYKGINAVKWLKIGVCCKTSR